MFHRVCLSHRGGEGRRRGSRAIAGARWIAQLIFDSEAVDHFGNLASYSAIRRRKTMGKTMTSAKSRRRPLPCCVQNVSVFPLLALRCSFFLLSRASSNRSPLGTVRPFIVAYGRARPPIVPGHFPSQFSPIRFIYFVPPPEPQAASGKRKHGPLQLFNMSSPNCLLGGGILAWVEAEANWKLTSYKLTRNDPRNLSRFTGRRLFPSVGMAPHRRRICQQTLSAYSCHEVTLIRARKWPRI